MANREMTPLELSACLFVAELASDIDARRGVRTMHGTPETQARVVAVVKERFFSATPARGSEGGDG